MVTETPNLKLQKPAGTDLVDVSVLNGNMDILDTQVDGKLDKAGGTMTGMLSVPVLSNSGDSYLTGTVFTSNAFSGPYVQVTADVHAPNLVGYNGVFIRRNDGYLLYRTFNEMKADLGINDKADKSDITSVYKVMGSCTTADLASKATTKGDVWNLTDAGSYGPIGTNVVYNGTEWDALGGTYDLSGYAKKSDIPDTSSKLDKSGGAMIGYLADKTASQVRNITTSTAEPSGGQDGDIWFQYE